MSHTLSLVAADGHRLAACVTGDPSASRAVVILQEIFGVNDHIRSVAETYANHGFYVVAPALFDRVERGVELEYSPAGLERARAIAARLTKNDVLRDIDAALAHARLSNPPRKVGVVGYCLGGSYAWHSATQLRLDAAVGYYGSKVASHLDEIPHAPVILHFGDQDRGIPLSDIEKIKTAHPAVPVYVYAAGHGFNRDSTTSYSELAAALALARTLDFLNTHLGASVSEPSLVPHSSS